MTRLDPKPGAAEFRKWLVTVIAMWETEATHPQPGDDPLVRMHTLSRVLKEFDRRCPITEAQRHEAQQAGVVE